MDAVRLRDLRELLRRIPSIPVVAAGHGKQPGSASLRGEGVDLLLYFGTGVLAREIQSSARLGAWCVQQPSLRSTRSVPAPFWDMYECNPTVRYGQEIVDQSDPDMRMVYRSSGIANHLSLALNENMAFWRIEEFLWTRLSKPGRLDPQVQCTSAADLSSESYRLNNPMMAKFLVRWTGRTLRHEIRKRLFREQWSIALQRKSERPQPDSMEGLKMLRPAPDRLYADPFLIDWNGRTYLFFEDYRYGTEKGLISCCEIDAAGNYGRPRVVLERSYHLSYPFLFSWQGEIYMIPETAENRTIELYRASRFPDFWVHEMDLMSAVVAVDSTLLHYRGKWWLFTAGVLDHTSPNEALFLFFADSPFGPWTAHPKNPIVSDPRCARPAGSLYFMDDQLIRPGQDCVRDYGYAIQLQRVDVLSETDYRETTFSAIRPELIRGSRGIHTYNQTEKFRVLDSKFIVPRLSFSQIASQFRRSGAESTSSLLREQV